MKAQYDTMMIPKKRVHEMFALIFEVYFYDNKLLEKALPETYNTMKKFYEEI